MRPKSVKFDGEKIEGFVRVDVGSVAPADLQGCPRGCTQEPFVVTLERAATAPPGTKGFDLVAGSDGSLRGVEVEIELENVARQVTQTLRLDDAYVANWSSRSVGNGLFERWVVHAGRVRLSAGGDNVTFDPDWHLLPANL